MAMRGDAAVDATREAARLTISTVVEGVTSGIIEIGAAAPVVAPLCVALVKAKAVVDGASRNKEELTELCEWCDLITVQVIDKAKASRTAANDLSPLQECIDKLKVVAERYHAQGCLARLARFRKDGDDIERLRARIEAVVPVMGLSVAMNSEEKLDQILARLQPGLKLAPVPRNAPDTTRSFHVVRDAVVNRACKILGGDGGPAMAALTGGSGTGKTTAAAQMVGAGGERVRTLFPDGVVWLRVGKGAGAGDRLPRLVLGLANRFHDDVMKGGVDAPEAGEPGESYVKNIVSQEKLRCLVVADDVWEPSVVQKLRETGMWVLLTTRFPRMVEPNERVILDTLTETEAEDVLRGAANLSPGERLCDAAKEALTICGRVAMDIAFVGSWSSVRAVNGEPKSNRAWARAVREIETHGGGIAVEREVNRLAILRAGFKYIGKEDALAQELYASLAVFPVGLAFGIPDAAVLLGDEEDSMGPISILERWGVLKADASETYRMHDAHVRFARDKLMGWECVRKPAVERWTSHISRLDVVISVDVYALLHLWWALEKVGGEGWWTSRPYDDQLVEMDIFDPSKSHAVNLLAELYEYDQKHAEVEALMQRVLTDYEDRGGGRPEVKMTALHYTMQSLITQGRFQEVDDIERRLGEMVGPSFQVQVPDCGFCYGQASTAFHVRGICAVAGGRLEEADEWFRKALKVEEDGGRSTSSQAVSTLHAMGRCARAAGRPEEAVALFKRSLKIKEAELGPDHPHVAWTLQNMGECMRQTGRLTEAEELFRRALDIREVAVVA